MQRSRTLRNVVIGLNLVSTVATIPVCLMFAPFGFLIFASGEWGHSLLAFCLIFAAPLALLACMVVSAHLVGRGRWSATGVAALPLLGSLAVLTFGAGATRKAISGLGTDGGARARVALCCLRQAVEGDEARQQGRHLA